MASIISLRRRIKTTQNVSKTTRAMEMIATSKLKKAQEVAISSRPYVDELTDITQTLTHRVEKAFLPDYMKHSDVTGKTLLIIIAPDKGLCGALITNLVKEVLKRNSAKTMYLVVGKKIESAVAYGGRKLVASFPFGSTLPHFDMVYPITKVIDEYFISDAVDYVDILSTHFENVFTQNPVTTSLLPVDPLEDEEYKKLKNKFQLFEPDVETILPDLLKHYIEMVVYQKILEGYLAEQAARMVSMQNATDNAQEMIEDLKLEYNTSRQEKITSELLDITSGMVNN